MIEIGAIVLSAIVDIYDIYIRVAQLARAFPL